MVKHLHKINRGVVKYLYQLKGDLYYANNSK